MPDCTRRTFLAATAAAATAFAAPRKMTMMLSPGSIGVKAGQRETLDYAARFGFESIEAMPGALAAMSDAELQSFLDDMKAKKVAWGNAGLPLEFRKSDDDFRAGITNLPSAAKALQRAGVARASTWILPGHASLTYLENLKQHARRLREAASVLGDHGQRLGLEYVGPKTAWIANRYPFVHNMKEMRELIAEINKPNVGFLIDSWHWYTAQETAEDLRSLTNQDIVSVDLNDAPSGVAVEQQVDNRRELPSATGVIDTAAFLNALNDLGCDAPVRAEPFNTTLRQLQPDQALQAVIQSMRKAFALIRTA